LNGPKGSWSVLGDLLYMADPLVVVDVNCIDSNKSLIHSRYKFRAGDVPERELRLSLSDE